MKKIFGIIAISAMLFACNDAADGSASADSASMHDSYMDTTMHHDSMMHNGTMDSMMNGNDMSDKHIQSSVDTAFDIGVPDSSSN